MRYVYIAISILSFIGGGFFGYRLAPGKGIREAVTADPTVTTEVEKIVTKTVTGDVTTRIVERKSVAPTLTEKPASQYRLGVLLPIGEPQDWSATAARRIVGPVWGELQYQHAKEVKDRKVLVGVGYEF